MLIVMVALMLDVYQSGNENPQNATQPFVPPKAPKKESELKVSPALDESDSSEKSSKTIKPLS